jgi:hypothetical protein
MKGQIRYVAAVERLTGREIQHLIPPFTMGKQPIESRKNDYIQQTKS